MARALSTLLIVVGFLALVGLAFMPRTLSIVLNIEDSSITQSAPPQENSDHSPADQD